MIETLKKKIFMQIKYILEPHKWYSAQQGLVWFALFNDTWSQ